MMEFDVLKSRIQSLLWSIISLGCLSASALLHADLLIDPSGGTVLFNDRSTFDDKVASGRSLGFTGSFFGNSKTTIDICTNGQANFVGDQAYNNQPLPSLSNVAYICPLWSDLIIIRGDGGLMTEKLVAGTYYSATWESIQDYPTRAINYTTQLVWFGNNHIINGFTFQENDIAFSYEAPIPSLPHGDATIGLARGSETVFASLKGVSNGLLSNVNIPLIPTSQDSFLLFSQDAGGNNISVFCKRGSATKGG